MCRQVYLTGKCVGAIQGDILFRGGDRSGAVNLQCAHLADIPASAKRQITTDVAFIKHKRIKTMEMCIFCHDKRCRPREAVFPCQRQTPGVKHAFTRKDQPALCLLRQGAGCSHVRSTGNHHIRQAYRACGQGQIPIHHRLAKYGQVASKDQQPQITPCTPAASRIGQWASCMYCYRIGLNRAQRPAKTVLRIYEVNRAAIGVQ